MSRPRPEIPQASVTLDVVQAPSLEEMRARPDREAELAAAIEEAREARATLKATTEQLACRIAELEEKTAPLLERSELPD